MKTLRDINEDTLLFVEGTENSVMTKADFMEAYSEEEAKDAEVYLAIKDRPPIFNIASALESIEDDQYPDWKWDVLDSIGDENIKMINKMVQDAIDLNPSYAAGEPVWTEEY